MNNSNLLQVIEASQDCLAPEQVELPTVCFVTPLSLADFVDPDLTIKGSRYIMAGTSAYSRWRRDWQSRDTRFVF